MPQDDLSLDPLIANLKPTEIHPRAEPLVRGPPRIPLDDVTSGCAELDLRLNGDTEREDTFNDGGQIAKVNRLRTAQRSSDSYGPTANLRGSLDIAKQEFDMLHGDLDAVLSGDLTALEKDLDAAGVPWTPGRGVGGRGE